MGKTYRLRTLYGPTDVPINELRDLTQTPQMRRTMRISVLGCVAEVYPDAIHHRFSHEIGVGYTARRIGENIGLSDEEIKLLVAYGFTHDIGHGPESHIWEYVVHNITGRDHKTEGIKRLREVEITSALKKAGIKKQDLIEMHTRENPLSRIIYELVGSDKLDYVWRDRHFCALDGGCDMQTLIKNITFDGETVCIDDKAKEEARDYLRTYLGNYHRIYLRKPVEIVKGLKTRAIYYAIQNGDIDPHSGWTMDDYQLNVALRKSEDENAKIYVAMLERREFPKTVGVLRLTGYENRERTSDMPIHVESASRAERDDLRKLSNGFDTDLGKITELETKIAKTLKLEPREVLLSLPRNFGDGAEKKIRIIRKTRERATNQKRFILEKYIPILAERLRVK